MSNEKQDNSNVRIQDIAREAGVSVATVSYVLNQKGKIGSETRERVIEVAERLHYRPNPAGRSLATKRSKAIGLIAPKGKGVVDPFFSLVAAGITEESTRLGYHIILVPGEISGEEVVSDFLNALVDGVFLLEVEQDDPRIRMLKSAQVPVTLLGRTEIPIGWVDVDNYRGGWMATSHLLELGHRRIGHLATPYHDAVGRLRRQGYEDCLRSWDRDCIPIVEEGPMDRDSGYQLGRKLLMMNPRPSAVFAASDIMAEGVMQAARELGIKIPRDLSVVGFDDIPLASQLTAPLTTISQNAFDIGRQMAKQMVDQLDGQFPEQHMLMPELVVRESTGPVSRVQVVPRGGERITLKSGSSFSLWTPSGTVDPNKGDQGIFCADTHWLNAYQVRVDGLPMDPVWSSVTSEGYEMRYVLALKDGTLDCYRRLAMKGMSLVDEWQWTHWDGHQEWEFDLQVSPDFRDIFELRGFEVESKGIRRSELHEDGSERHYYMGKDGVAREMGISLEPRPSDNELGFKRWRINGSEKQGRFAMQIGWNVLSGLPGQKIVFPDEWPQINVDNSTWQRVLERAQQDIDLLRTDFGFGPILVAGLPWFGTMFGRDAIISALQVLSVQPYLAENTLASLAHYQGTVVDPSRGEMPGKMVHEVRIGELANTGVIPFGRYYGSVDVTPLYITLLEATWRRTGRVELLHKYLSVAEAALSWIQEMISRSSHGLLTFDDEQSGGLVVQSWKDSSDSMVYGDGQQARPPLAVAEVQGYAFQALLAMATIYEALHQIDKANELRKQAHELQERFHQQFWDEQLQYYAMATDATDRHLDVLSSDAGHCLWTGIIPTAYREAIVHKIMSDDLFSGWGIRTLGANEKAYNPFSYHRGSIWPHDSSLIAAGMARSGFLQDAIQLSTALIQAADRHPEHRLPELFSGVARTDFPHAPLPYPLACAPQAWASGTPWILLESVLHLEIDALSHTLGVHHAPPELGIIQIRGLQVGNETVDLVITSEQVAVDHLPEGWRLVTF